MNGRPFGITILSAWYVITGALGVLGGLVASIFGVFAICFNPGVLPSGIVGVVIGALGVILGLSLWAGKDWAPGVVTVLAIIGLIGGVLNLIAGNGLPVVNMAINALVLFYVNSDGVKRYFATR